MQSLGANMQSRHWLRILAPLLLWTTLAWAQPLAPKREPAPAGNPIEIAGAQQKDEEDKARDPFAIWWSEHRISLPAFIKTRCDEQSTKNIDGLEAWCKRYTARLPPGVAEQFDILALLSSDGLVLAAYQSQKEALLKPIEELRQLIEEEAKQPRKVRASTPEGTPSAATAAAEAAAAREARLAKDIDYLERATGAATKNSPSAAALSGQLPSIDMDALLQKLFSGIALALEERAEQEAVAFVLYEFNQRICLATTTELRLWLPNTCEVARQGAYGSGLVSISLLRRSIEEDLRRWPGNLAFVTVQKGAQGRYAKMAPSTRGLVDAVAHGTPPVRALDVFSQQLVAVEKDFQDGQERKNIQALACLSGIPLALPRINTQVDSMSRGLTPAVSEPQKELAVLQLSLDSTACRLFYGASTKHLFHRWLEDQPHLLMAASGVKKIATDLTSVLDTRERSLLVKQGLTRDTPEQERVANEQRANETVALIGREGIVALEGAARVAMALSQLSLPNEHKTALVELQVTLRSAGNALQMLVEVLSRDMSAAYQRFLKHQASHIEPSAKNPAPCASSKTVTHDEALVDEEAAKAMWRCTARPCICAPGELVRYGGLIVALADAKDDEAVKKTLLSAAAPVGSWRLKQDTAERSMVTLGGLVGFGTDYRAIRPSGSRFQPRLLVPFGLDITMGGIGAPWASFFIQGIDLAGYTNFSSDDRDAPRVLEAVSPGLSLKASLPKTPFGIVAGMAYDLDAGGATPRGAWRGNIGLAIDVSLFVLR